MFMGEEVALVVLKVLDKERLDLESILYSEPLQVGQVEKLILAKARNLVLNDFHFNKH